MLRLCMCVYEMLDYMGLLVNVRGLFWALIRNAFEIFWGIYHGLS